MGRDQSQIRINSEVGTVKHVEALQFFFSLAKISSIVFSYSKCFKTWPLHVPHTAVCVVGGGLVVVVVGGGGGGGGWGGGGQDVITIKTSTMTPLSAAVSRVLLDGAVVTNVFHSHNACWYMRALNSNGNEHRR